MATHANMRTLVHKLTHTLTNSLFLYHAHAHTANPAVFISTKLKYVLPGDSSTLIATVYAFPQEDAIAEWYLNGQRINIDSDNRYSSNTDGNQYTLQLRSVDASLLGEYEIVVTVQGQNSSDFVNLTFPGE